MHFYSSSSGGDFSHLNIIPNTHSLFYIVYTYFHKGMYYLLRLNNSL